MCFSIDNPDSLDNVTEKWLPEVNHFCPTVPILLVGTKKDLRNDPDVHEELSKRKLKPVSKEDARLVAERTKCYTYIECSALTREGVREVFDTAAKAALLRRKNESGSKCRIL